MTKFIITTLSFFLGLLLSLSGPQSSASPKYNLAFPQDRIVDFHIVIQPQDWIAMRDNMSRLYGRPGEPLPSPHPTEKPMWVNAQIEHAGKIWKNVAVRYKGNSSLLSVWKKGGHKLPFKINFSKFENKQLFFGFKELSLSNSAGDNTFLIEPLVYQLLAEVGLPASRTAFYHLSVDYGEGKKDYGLYNAVEVIDDTVVANFFGEDSGNIYEAEGSGATLGEYATVEMIKQSFQKKNNKSSNDFSDLVGLQYILNSNQRLLAPDLWRTELENCFEVKEFLKWFALSTVLEHFDTYGRTPHNYYLYNRNGKLHWISWDHNGILGSSPQDPGDGNFDRTDVTSSWPLIRFLLDDPVFGQEYRIQLKNIKDHHFKASKIEGDLRRQAEMIKHSISESQHESLEKSLNLIIRKIYSREKKLLNWPL